MERKHYESVIIINAALEDEQIDATISRIEEIIKSNGGEITHLDKWGRKRLAYPIQKSKSGYYVVIQIFAPSDLISKLERMYRIDETVIRYLTVGLDKQALDYISEQKERNDSESSEEITAQNDKDNNDSANQDSKA